MNWFKKLLVASFALAMVFAMMPTAVRAEGEAPSEDAIAAFKEALEKDGYAEMGSYKVEKMRDGVYHMDEETKAVPGGATIPDYIDRETGETKTGVMNNPSSMYFVVTDNEVVMIDGGDVLRSQEKYDSAKAILKAMTNGKPLTFIVTHGHSDHVRMFTTEGVLDDIDVKALYIGEADYVDGKVVGSTTATPLPVLVDLDKVHTVKEGDVITVDGLDYEIIDIPAHTPGSLAIVQRDKEVIFTGDSIGSGFVWAFWMYGDNPLGALQNGVSKLQGVIQSMSNGTILAGHRWQQFTDMFGAGKPNEMSIQYLNDMNQVIGGLADGTTLISPYTLRGNDADLELSATGSKAKIDTQQPLIDAYLKSLITIDEAYVYSGSSKLSIESSDATAAPLFVIFPDGALSDEEAQKLLDDAGYTEVIDRSASKAYVMRPLNGETFEAADLDRFLSVVKNQIVLTSNFKLVGIGNGATFINKYLTGYMNFVSGLAIIGGEPGETPKAGVPAYIAGADASAYIEADNAQGIGGGRYVNNENRFEYVVTADAPATAAEGLKDAWDKVLCLYGRIGNYIEEEKVVATWYTRPLITGNKEADQARKYQFFDSLEAVEGYERFVNTEDLNGSGTLSLWYEYIPDCVKDAEAGTVPVVFLMHGNTNDPRTQVDTAAWANIAVRDGVILVAPEWQGHVYQGYAYEPMSDKRGEGDETYVISVLEKVLEKYPQADATRVYMSGLSAGSMQTTTYGLSNPKYFAAGGGHSGPFFGDMGSAQKYAADYDFPVIYFSGDCDEYLMSGFYETDFAKNGGISCLNAFRVLNDMPALTQDDYSEENAEIYGVPWDEVYTIEPTAENIPEIVGGILSNDKDVEISFNRIKGWGHWNYAPDTEYMWDFMKKYARDPETGASIRLDLVNRIGGTQVVHVVGDDWGPAVDKTLVTVETPVKADSLKDFAVLETKEAFNWGTFEIYTAETEREVLDVYLADEAGNRIDAEEGNIIAVEMYVSPSVGSPFFYDLFTGFNRWVDQYSLKVCGSVETAEGAKDLVSEQEIDFYDNEMWYSEIADSFNQATYTAPDGTPIVYGEFVPEEGEDKALVIWLHGAGEGTNKGVNDNYIDLLGNEVTAFATEDFQKLFGGAYVVTPQAPTMWMDDGTGAYQNGDIGSCYEPALFAFIEWYVAEHPDIDPNRIIIGGCSNGGYMTMEMTMKHPGYFYKAYPICEAFQDQYITDEMIEAVKEGGTKYWFVYALSDTTVNPDVCEKPTIERFKAAGIETHVTEWEKVEDLTGRFTDEEGNPYEYSGHWSWIYFDNNACTEGDLNCWKWLAAYEGYTGFKDEEGNKVVLTPIDGKLYWFENGEQQGVYGDKLNIWDTQYDKIERGREIYDPNTDAWYWLDANDNGAVAIDKEVWMPYIFQGEDPATEGKWVRYDKYGQMIKGWYANDNGVYYYDQITGAMLKGTHEINGKTYTFDTLTGIMQ